MNQWEKWIELNWKEKINKNKGQKCFQSLKCDKMIFSIANIEKVIRKIVSTIFASNHTNAV